MNKVKEFFSAIAFVGILVILGVAFIAVVTWETSFSSFRKYTPEEKKRNLKNEFYGWH